MDSYARSVDIFRRLGNRSGQERSQKVLDELRRLSSGDITLQSSNLYAK